MPLLFFYSGVVACKRKILTKTAMKTSIILIVLILFNTTALISKAIAILIKDVNPWLFIGVEILLLIGFYAHMVVKDVRKISNIDFSDLNIFVIKGNAKK